MATDALSDLLRTVRLTGAAYFEITAQAPWSVRSPAREMMLPSILPGADHLIAYHVVTQGRCFASLVGGEPVPVEAGEVVVFTNADPHVMSSSAGMRAEAPSADMIEIASAGRLPFPINLMNDGAPSAKLVCGYLACDARPFNPLLESLPQMLKAGEGRRNDSGWVGQFIHFAVAEVADKRAGSESVLTKLSELMFIDVVRRYIETVPAQHTGWLAGLRDPLVGKALAMIHARPSFNWTVEGLARQCGASRTVLAERFVQLAGIPPMHYLAKWRMQVASELLNGNANMATIAAQVGYDSEAAFSRAFKKMIGVAPSLWRQGMRSPGAS
jgi:AraC-like DNA-binding protein